MFINLIKKLMPKVIKDEIKSLIISKGTSVNECIYVGVRFVCWNQIPGDYLEFGCYSGKTFSYAYQMSQLTRKSVTDQLTEEDKKVYERTKPRFFAFDSFEGLPPETMKVDDHPYLPKHWKKVTYTMSVEEFEKILAKKGISKEDIYIVKGWYHETLTDKTKKTYNLERAGMVHIDCDYYESAILVLDFISDLVDDGTVIVFDDYNFFRGFSQLGERRAFSEWLRKNPHIKATELARHDFHSVAFFLNVKR